MITKNQLDFSLPAAEELARAAQELAAARPIVLCGSAEVEGWLVLPAENATPARLAALRAEGDLTLVLSPQRASHLKLRQYTQEAIALSVATDWDAGTVRSIADPGLDLDRAMRGPLESQRGPLPAAFVAALRLVRAAECLPCALIVQLQAKNAAVYAAQNKFILLAAKTMLEAEPIAEFSDFSAEIVTQARLPLKPNIAAELIAFRPKPQGLWGAANFAATHYALAIGAPDPGRTPLVRLHSECFTGDLLGSLKCDCGDQLRGAIEKIAAEGSGLLLYLRQEGRGIGLLNKLRAYRLQDQGLDTVEANERLGFADDERSFAPAAAMLRAMEFKRIRLLTNNPRKVTGLEAEGIEVTERVGHEFPDNPHNAHYLAIKRDKSGHLL